MLAGSGTEMVTIAIYIHTPIAWGGNECGQRGLPDNVIFVTLLAARKLTFFSFF